MALQLVISAGLLAGVALLVGLYLLTRPRGHPVEDAVALVPRAAAERRALEIAEDLLGRHLEGWRTHSALVRDDDGLDAVAATGPRGSDTTALVQRWGLSGEWRVQFTGPADHGPDCVLVGLNGRNELVLWKAGRRHEGSPGCEPLVSPGPGEVLSRLRPFGGHWHHVRPIGRGAVDRSSGGEELTVHVQDDSGPVTVEVAVTSAGGRIQQIDRMVHVDESATAEHLRRQARHDLAGTSAVLASVAGLVIGLFVLLLGDLPLHLGLALGLGLLTVALSLAGDAMALRSSIVGVYDGQIPLWLFRLISGGTMVTISVLYGVVVLIAAGAGSALAADAGLEPLDDVRWQLVVGPCAAAVWLAFSASFYALLDRARLCRLTRHPNGDFVRRSGLPWTRSSLAAGVSAISEETVFRLLGVPLVFSLTGSEIGAALVTAVVWAFVHSGQVTDPPVFRLVELSVVGLALAFVLLHVGLVAVLVAHAVFNTVVLRSHSRVVADRLLPDRTVQDVAA
jgi:hypothetical protein